MEPHFFAGFSGGPKMVAPGLAGLETTLELHNARRIGDPRATWGVIEGNPVHDAVRAIAAATGVDFALDVLLNDEQRITQAFGGASSRCTRRPVVAARAEAMQPVSRPFDLVITTNSGYPLDQNLYQAVKGMSAASEIVRPGGTIICAAECRDGLPDHGPYGRLLRRGPIAGGPAGAHRGLAGHDPRPVAGPDPGSDPVKAHVLLRTDGLSDDAVRAAHLEPIADIGEAVAARCRGRPWASDRRLATGPADDPLPHLGRSPGGRLVESGRPSASGRRVTSIDDRRQQPDEHRGADRLGGSASSSAPASIPAASRNVAHEADHASG